MSEQERIIRERYEVLQHRLKMLKNEISDIKHLQGRLFAKWEKLRERVDKEVTTGG